MYFPGPHNQPTLNSISPLKVLFKILFSNATWQLVWRLKHVIILLTLCKTVPWKYLKILNLFVFHYLLRGHLIWSNWWSSAFFWNRLTLYLHLGIKEISYLVWLIFLFKWKIQWDFASLRFFNTFCLYVLIFVITIVRVNLTLLL